MKDQTTGYDIGWIQNALTKREANYSNVICVETGDPFRFNQLSQFLMGPEFKNIKLYSFSKWAGLMTADGSKRVFEPVTVSTGGGYAPDLQNSLKETRLALLHMDEVLKKEKAIFILYDLDASREEERDQEIINAVRDWTYNSEIFLSGSIVLFVCKNPAMVLDPVTLERTAIIRPPLAEACERRRCIMDSMEKILFPDSINSNELNKLVQFTAGLNLHQIETVLLESYFEKQTFSEEKIKELKSEIIKNTDLLEIEEPDQRGFGSVGGYEVVKKFVQSTIIKVLNEPARAARLGIRSPRGLILFGPPGTGKTLFARALAREVHLPFINFRTENLFSQYLGVSGHRFRDAINLVEQMSPAIVFIDEIDKLGQRRETANDGASEESRRVFNQILEWLGKKERQSIIVGTTNRPEDLDKAFRVGRIDYWIPFLYPNEKARYQILKIHLKGTDIDQDLIEEIATLTNGFSGAELEELCHRARRRAFTCNKDRIEKEDIIYAYHSYRINHKTRHQEREYFLQKAESITNDLAFLEQLKTEK